jgi:hypothetical protein
MELSPGGGGSIKGFFYRGRRVENGKKLAIALAAPMVIEGLETLSRSFLYCALGVLALAVARVLPAIG